MKKIITGIVLAVTMASAFAACPPGQPYRCYQGMNGKMVCGCGV